MPNPHLGRWEQAWRAAEARKEALSPWTCDKIQGPNLLQIPSTLAGAPVNLIDIRDGSHHPMRFVSGMFGVVQDPESLALMPEFGWAVVHDA